MCPRGELVLMERWSCLKQSRFCTALACGSAGNIAGSVAGDLSRTIGGPVPLWRTVQRLKWTLNLPSE